MKIKNIPVIVEPSGQLTWDFFLKDVKKRTCCKCPEGKEYLHCGCNCHAYDV